MFRSPLVDLLVILAILALFIGPKRLPQLGRSLGSGIREFKDSITGGGGGDDEKRPGPAPEPGDPEQRS